MYFVYFPYSNCSMFKFTYSGPHRWLPDHKKRHKYAKVISFFLKVYSDMIVDGQCICKLQTLFLRFFQSRCKDSVIRDMG